MNIRPLADRVLIKPAAAEEKTLGGIIITDSAPSRRFSYYLIHFYKQQY